MYVGVSLTEASLRTGFDVRRHAWSQLALGGPGWVHVLNLVLSGLLVGALAVGLGRTLDSRAVTVVFAVFGASMVVAGMFRVDPGNGFPVGMSAPGVPSAGALVHFAAGAVGFPAASVGLLVMGRRLRATGRHGRLAMACAVVAPVFLAAFAVMASGLAGTAAGLLGFTAALIALFTVLTVAALRVAARQVAASS